MTDAVTQPAESSCAARAAASYPASPRAPIHWAFWLAAPLLFTAFQFAIERWMRPDLLAAVMAENGLHETIEFFMMAAATVVAWRTFRRLDRRVEPIWLVAWVAVALIGCFFVAGEEIDWGQNYLHWKTPAEWARINGQGEMNLHNTTQWLNRKPRHLINFGILVGGILIPLLRRWKPGWLPRRFAIIYGPSILAVTATAHLFMHKFSAIEKRVYDVRAFHSINEVDEVYIYYFILLYLIALGARLPAPKPSPETPVAS